MKILQVAPGWFRIPPTGYGGIEHVVAGLTDSLAKLGHEVHLISAGHHKTQAVGHQTLTEPAGSRIGELLPELLHRSKAQEIIGHLDIDVVHDHTMSGVIFPELKPTLSTIHGSVVGEEGRLLELSARRPLLAISKRQRELNPSLPWRGVVYNGIDFNSFQTPPTKEGFALFLGRMTPDKGPDLAIQAARQAGIPLVVAAKCRERQEHEYFSEIIEPMLGPDETWLGEVDQPERDRLLGNASVLLLPLRWEEPFGMVMIEAMASGTPVVATRRGSTAEIIDDGVTGCLVDHIDQLPSAIERTRELDCHQVRTAAESRFSSDVMARHYLDYYESL